MLAVLGFVTILLVLALIMSKKVSTLVALIFVPAITGFIAAFINAPNVIIQAAQAAAEKAGTAYVDPVITFGTRFTKALSILSADYMGKGLSSIVAPVSCSSLPSCFSAPARMPVSLILSSTAS